MNTLLAHPDAVAYLYTHVQSGDVEVRLEEDYYSEFPDNQLWHKTPLYQAFKPCTLLHSPQDPQNHFTQRFSRVE